MARHKEFDRDNALHAAIGVFSEHGYEGTSTDELLRAMKISRQSMYDTFGDKRGLYLEALERYNADSIGKIVADLRLPGQPIKALEAPLSLSLPVLQPRRSAAASASAPFANSAAPTQRSGLLPTAPAAHCIPPWKSFSSRLVARENLRTTSRSPMPFIFSALRYRA